MKFLSNRLLPKKIVENQGRKFARAMRYGFVDFMRDIAKWLLIGLAIAALFDVIIPDDFFTAYVNNRWLNMLLVLVASIPLYVCATGSVPIAAVLMLKGLSPGAALVFLMAGPATNAATFTVIAKELGKKTTLIYLLTIALGSMFFGFLIDAFLPASWFQILSSNSGDSISHIFPSWFYDLSSVILAILLIYSVIKLVQLRIVEKKSSENIANVNDSFIVDGMTCKNCKAHIVQSVKSVDFVKDVFVDLDSGELSVSGKNVDSEKIISAVEKAGYHCMKKN